MNRYSFSASERIPAEQRNAKAAEVARAEVERMFGVLDAAVTGKEWLVGNSFSIVDAHVAAFVTYSSFIGFDTKKWANLEAWRVRTTSRPAYGKVMAP
jgi:glutathione S-transferase